MTISQSSIKQTLEKESNFNQTIKMFEQNNSGSHKPLRKSLIPTIINQTQQKNYYSKYPFDKIVETTTTTTTQKTLLTTANSKAKNDNHLPKATNESVGFNPQLEIKGEHKELRKSLFHRNLAEKNSSESSNLSNDTKDTKSKATSNSTDINQRLRIDTTPQHTLSQYALRAQQVLSPPAITPRKQTSIGTPQQTFLPPAELQSNNHM